MIAGLMIERCNVTGLAFQGVVIIVRHYADPIDVLYQGRDLDVGVIDDDLARRDRDG